MKKGFTLIELLIVIAIIGILASIVLVSLGGARNKAKDARIIADMSQIRSTAEIYLASNGSYQGLCDSTDISNIASDTASQGGKNYYCQVSSSPFNDYCAEVELNSGKWWCVDSKLRSKQYDANPQCDNTHIQCQ